MKKIKSQKQLQVGENYKREMSQIFLQDDLLSFKSCHITILEADVSPDLKNVKFYLDVFGDNLIREKIIPYLNKMQPYLKKEIANRIKARSVPDLKFILDNTGSNALRIDELLKNK